MTDDTKIVQAVSNIVIRADKEPSHEVLAKMFVDCGIYAPVSSFSNQIIYGRRGTGKTHLLREIEYRHTQSDITVFIDCRMLGNIAKKDASNTTPELTYSFFQDIYAAIYHALRDEIISFGTTELLSEFDILNTIMFEKSYISQPVARETNSEKGYVKDTISGIEMSQKSSLSLKKETSNADSIKVKQVYEFREENSEIVIIDVNKCLTRVLKELKKKLIILVDEWSSIPFDLQPYCAEILKKAFLSNQYICTKISAIEYRSNFFIKSDHNSIGLEAGSDISVGLDLDDYYVYLKNESDINTFFLNILEAHITSSLPDNYLHRHSIHSLNDLITKLFTNKNAFNELVIASEGVIRDFLLIFSRAFFLMITKRRKTIAINYIRECAHKHYMQEKDRNIGSSERDVLLRIIDHVIKEKKAKCFMVDQKLAYDSVIMSLFDSRAIHIIERSYSSKHHKGVRYYIFSLDYGTYVELIRSKEYKMLANGGGCTHDNEYEEAVPISDKRSVRTIVLDPWILNPFYYNEETITRKREREYQTYLSAAFSLDKRIEIAREIRDGIATIDEASKHYGVRIEDLKSWDGIAKKTFKLNP